MVVEIRPKPYILLAEMEGLALGMRRFKEPLSRAVVKVLAPSIAENFAVGGKPPWRPLAQGTLDVRDLIAHVGSQPLVLTGRLQSIASSPAIWEVGDDYAQVHGLPGAEYGGIHQLGAEATGNGATIPARPFIDIQEEDADKVELIIDEWIAGLLIVAGFKASALGVGESAGGGTVASTD
jgi:phage gpG-like protein